MDTFTEQLTKKNMSILDYILILFMFVFIILEPIFCLLISKVFPAINYIFIVLFVLSVYLGIKIISSRFIEFEYIITNGNITIDKILSKRTRKEVISFDVSDIDKFEKYNKNIDLSEFKKVYKTQTTNEMWYAVFKDNKLGKVAVIFSPNEKTLGAIKPFLKRQVLIDAFGRN